MEDEIRREERVKKRKPPAMATETSGEELAEPRRANSDKKPRKERNKKRKDSSSTDSDSSGTKELEPAKVAASHWSLLATIWPAENRPDNLQREEVVNAIDFATLLAMAKYQKESRMGAAGNGPKSSYTKETLPSSTIFKENKDDGVKKLHPARFLRLPLADHKKWWHMMPLTRGHKYRNFSLKFLGCQGQVAQKTIENMHHRSYPHLLKHFF